LVLKVLLTAVPHKAFHTVSLAFGTCVPIPTFPPLMTVRYSDPDRLIFGCRKIRNLSEKLSICQVGLVDVRSCARVTLGVATISPFTSSTARGALVAIPRRVKLLVP
jgi:hypothetical protein